MRAARREEARRGRRAPRACSVLRRRAALRERRPWPPASGRGAQDWGHCHSADALAGSALRPLPGQVQVGEGARRASRAWIAERSGEAIPAGRRVTDIGQRPRGECVAPRRPGSWTPKMLVWPRGSPRSCPRGPGFDDRVGEGSAAATAAVAEMPAGELVIWEKAGRGEGRRAGECKGGGRCAGWTGAAGEGVGA